VWIAPRQLSSEGVTQGWEFGNGLEIRRKGGLARQRNPALIARARLQEGIEEGGIDSMVSGQLLIASAQKIESEGRKGFQFGKKWRRKELVGIGHGHEDK
jgi:hypothetical protein